MTELKSGTVQEKRPKDLRQTLIRIATFLGGIYFFLEYMLPEKLLSDIGVTQAHEPISQGFIVMGVMAIGLGIINIVASHGQRVAYLRKGWINSAALLVGMCSTFFVMWIIWIDGLETNQTTQSFRTLSVYADRIASSDESAVVKAEKIKILSLAAEGKIVSIDQKIVSNRVPQALKSDFEATLEKLKSRAKDLDTQLSTDLNGATTNFSKAGRDFASAYGALLRHENEKSVTQRIYTILYQGLFIPLGSAMFALLGVYIASAAYRAFRISSFEATLMMVTAALVILGQVSFGDYPDNPMPYIRQWLLEVPNSAAFRAIRIGAAIAGLILSIRMWLSIESSAHHTSEVES